MAEAGRAENGRDDRVAGSPEATRDGKTKGELDSTVKQLHGSLTLTTTQLDSWCGT